MYIIICIYVWNFLIDFFFHRDHFIFNFIPFAGLDDDYAHFWPILNLSRLLSSERICATLFYFPYCRLASRTEDKLKNHIEACFPQGLQTVSMPKGEKAVIEFKDFYNKMPFQYRIFVDFKSII